ncbi:MAG: acetyl-CoA decarbonylase/synthase complex subunit gamma [Candidatus Cloacimonetes bacterium]|nr:acetyl-CoA decarbonylase/synthase complex subunit gamma [Candidatus Cloacimonadota bacterium]
MALTGLEIFKLLPNKNCGECGVPTCLAFAMKLAGKIAEPEVCPYISDEALEILGTAQSPPIKKLAFKYCSDEISIGAETVMFRHEKTFVNQTLLALEISDALNEDEFNKELNRIESYKFERVGEMLEPECISLKNESDDKNNYLQKLEIISSKTGKIIILGNCNSEMIKESIQLVDNKRMILNRVQNLEETLEIISDSQIPIVVQAKNLEELFVQVSICEAQNSKNIILSIDFNNLNELLEDNVYLRRLAIKKGIKLAGYPILTECNDEDSLSSTILGICKYSSIIILKNFTGASLFPFLTLRQNIFTDPQKPLQIDSGIYKVGEPDENSPLIVTTNFSLTYFIVSGEIENSIYPVWLFIVDAEGMSVLTAWSANKFSGEIVGRALKNSGIDEKINHRRVIIPGYVAIISGELEDELKDWEVLVGPQEAADIPKYLKETWR